MRWAVQVEGLSRQFRHAHGGRITLGIHVLGQLGKYLQVHPNSPKLQEREDFHQRQIHLVVKPP